MKPRINQDMSQYLKTCFLDLSDIYGCECSSNFSSILLIIPATLQKTSSQNLTPTLRYEFSNFAGFKQFSRFSRFFAAFLAKPTKFENSYLSVGVTSCDEVFCSVAGMMSSIEEKLLLHLIHRYLTNPENGFSNIDSCLDFYGVSHKVVSVAEKRLSRPTF